MKVTIHQPEFMIWLGLVDKIAKADTFVIADTFQVKKNYYDNRNKIRTAQGEQWVGIPISKDNHLSFKEVKIAQVPWQNKLLNSIKYSYSKSPYFKLYFPLLENIIKQNNSVLFDYNYALIKLVLESFGINRKIILTSELNLTPELKGTDLLVEICQKVNADIYLSGTSGKDYLQVEKFNYIKVEFHSFTPFEYPQQYDPFMPFMSSFDYLFNCGEILWNLQ